MKIIKILFFLLISVHCFSQKIDGIVVSNNGKEPISYVNIGVQGMNIGTVSDIKGRFTLQISDTIENKSVTFSSVGYKTKSFSLMESFKISEFIMEEDSTTLQEVNVISSKRSLKTKILGNTTDSRNMRGHFKDDQLGNELGTLIKINRAPTFIESFTVNIAENLLDTAVFRLNIYTVKKGMPNEKLLHKNVIIKTSQKYGPVKIDLKEYNLVATDDFIIALEWIENLPPEQLFFSVGMLGSSMYIRHTSQGEWERVKGINIGMFVTVKQ